ncbi:hypothetical protein CBL_06886 [Carabus blaptoides fortunei]
MSSSKLESKQLPNTLTERERATDLNQTLPIDQTDEVTARRNPFIKANREVSWRALATGLRWRPPGHRSTDHWSETLLQCLVPFNQFASNYLCCVLSTCTNYEKGMLVISSRNARGISSGWYELQVVVSLLYERFNEKIRGSTGCARSSWIATTDARQYTGSGEEKNGMNVTEPGGGQCTSLKYATGSRKTRCSHTRRTRKINYKPHLVESEETEQLCDANDAKEFQSERTKQLSTGPRRWNNRRLHKQNDLGH